MSTTTKYREGDVVTYRSERENNWCREGMAIARADGKLCDTYWGTNFGDNHVLTESEAAGASLEFNVSDYREASRYEYPAWDEYHPDDRQIITSQHRLQSRRYLKLGATPDRGTQIEKARSAVADAEENVRSAESSLRCAKRALAEVEAQA